MKKFIYIFLVLVVFLGFSGNVYASPNDDLYNYASKLYNLGGEDFVLDEGNLKAIKRYLSENEISRENADKIIEKVDEVAAVLNEYNTSDPTKLPKEKKKKILNIAKEAAILAGASVTWDNTSKTLTIYDGKGKKVDVVELVKPVDEKGNRILSQTGNNYLVYIILISSFITCGTLYLYGKKRNV